MPQSPASPSHPVDFSELGRPRPKAEPSVRALPPVAEPSGELDELSADDILESDEIEPFEAAAAGIASFEVPKAEPSGFEVGDVGTFDEAEVRVEGLAPTPAEPAAAAAAPMAPPAPAPAAVTEDAPKADAPTVEAPKVEVAASASMKVDYVAPAPATLIGVPAAPVTSPMPLESVIVNDDSNDDSNVRTLEIRGKDMARVAAAAAALDQNEPQHTEVLKRSDMPAALHVPTIVGGMQAVHSPPPTSVYTPGFDQNARTNAQRASSIDPMAVDVAARSAMASSPAHAPMPAGAAYVEAPAKKPMTGLVIGGLAFAAVALIGVVGIGGFAASRALADKTDPASPATAQAAAEANTAAPAAAPETAAAAAAAAAPAEPAAATTAATPAVGAADPASPATLDVSSLPAAPGAGAAPRGVSGGSAAPSTTARTSTTSTTSSTSGHTSTTSGIKTTALPPPGATGKSASTPLPPPAAAAAPAPARAASESRTGVVRVDPNLRAVVVDGSYRRANEGVLVVSCGVHRIKAGMGETKTVKVPCGGAVSL